MSAQSRGTVRLRSSEPGDPPLIDPGFLSHPFDRRLAIEAVRETLKLIDVEHLARDQKELAAGPTSRGDDEILVGLGQMQPASSKSRLRF